MIGQRALATALLGGALLLIMIPAFPRQVIGMNEVNIVANPSFENNQPSTWFKTATYGNGTVNIYDLTYAHSGSYSAMLSAINTTQHCPTSTECKDTVRAQVEQYIQYDSPPTLNNTASGDSFTAWWYVADPGPTGLPTYSLHIGLDFTDGSSIEYWYGTSDLANQRYNLGPIPATASWFQMRRNLLRDIQGVVNDPSSTRVSDLWLAAFGGTYQGAPHGETAWVDDVVLDFSGGPVAAFSSQPASGTVPLTVAFNAVQSHEISGSTGSIRNYKWDFGDGSSPITVTNPTTSHTYYDPGKFKVTLTVTDSNGTMASSSSIITVDPADLTVPLVAAGGGGLLLLGGLLFTRFRRRPSKAKRLKSKRTSAASQTIPLLFRHKQRSLGR